MLIQSRIYQARIMIGRGLGNRPASVKLTTVALYADSARRTLTHLDSVMLYTTLTP